VPPEVAADAVERSLADPVAGAWRPTRELYGCNFAVRLSAAPELRFDERLPLYSWLEDHDFARRLMKFGVLAEVDDCVIVHRAAASGGRQAHRRLGYSQVMNPVHLWRKKSFPTWLAAYELFPRVGKNFVRSIAGREASWRRQRVRGNLLAAVDIVRGRITPERITQL
jgi:GT2 family glycosyltransferase